jgi:hypothetical protein
MQQPYLVKGIGLEFTAHYALFILTSITVSTSLLVIFTILSKLHISSPFDSITEFSRTSLHCCFVVDE